MTMEGFLDERADRLESAGKQAERDAYARQWLWGDRTPEQRLLAFDTWVRVELETRIDWTWAGAAKKKRIEQCRIELDRLLKDLAVRGWNIDGRKLAGLIRDALDEVGKAQREGRVKDFWPFFRSVVGRFVGTNAEEIRETAMSLGSHIGQVFQALAKRAPAAASIPELVAQRSKERLVDRLARQRAKDAARIADAQQPQLF
jgi:hypothetical protein